MVCTLSTICHLLNKCGIYKKTVLKEEIKVCSYSFGGGVKVTSSGASKNSSVSLVSDAMLTPN